MIRPKATHLRLDPLSYESLRQQVLRRDDWRCQSFGALSNLGVHTRSSAGIRGKTLRRT